jgi:TPR repeat protein
MFRSVRVVLLLAGFATDPAGPTCADSSLTTQGLAAFSHAQYAEALRDWQLAAEAGDGQAALYIGLLNDLGRGVPQDVQAAQAWYKRAAALGNAVAMFNVGVLYDSGISGTRNRAVAAEWYEKAAAQGMGRAAYALGLMYKAGDGVPPNRKRAAIYFRQALTLGVTAARAHLVSLGEPPDMAARTKAAAGDVRHEPDLTAFDRAQDLLLQRSPQAQQQAAVLLRQAAEKGDLLAAYDLGYCYEKGIGVQADRVQAYVWYVRASRSSTTTVQRAAVAGMQTIARQLTASELAAAQSAAAAFGQPP